MPAGDTVSLVPLTDALSLLERVGLKVRWQRECTRSHQATADSLTNAFAAEATEIAAHLGRPALNELLAAQRLWSHWLRNRRVRKFAIVADKVPTPRARG